MDSIHMEKMNLETVGVQDTGTSPQQQSQLDALMLLNRKVSPLLRLPSEVRLMIYAYVIGGHHISFQELDIWKQKAPARRIYRP
ncbi:hypothetical protein CC86DRAFT_401522 [Ophiobolus disseminans]|uniref:Uncharacterized protein n=1 Tax=Ophiobolus disseminans TaxID=1469910 RepID=A0A6A7AE74_9PLEO|nr:hypothetical protein CC86DRAFT_401522 [Ophiobolus disseminans]